MQGENQAGQDTPVENEAQTPAATTETVDTQEATTQGAEGEKTPAVEKTYTKQEVQEQIERATAKAAAKAERRAYREATQRLSQVQQPAQQQVDERPARANGESDDDYLDRLTDWKLDKREQAGKQQRQQAEMQSLQAKTEKIYAEAEKIEGFDREDFESLPLTQTIATAIVESDVAAKLMAHFTDNPEEITRIAALKPVKQAAEIGKLEDRLTTQKTTKAPPPITPVGSKGVNPVDPERMSMDQYAKWRRDQGASWAR